MGIGEGVGENLGEETGSNLNLNKLRYLTNFTSSESPLSEGGAWTTGLADGSDWTDPVTSGGIAYGTVVHHTGTPYDDSIAHLSGFAANHYAEATIYQNSPASTMECELLLRFAITNGNARGYEVLIPSDSNAGEIVRWNGTLNDFTALDSWSHSAPVTGDVFRAEISGTVITVKKNGTIVRTYDTASDSTKWSDGNPGIGFFNRYDQPDNSFAWSSFEAGNL